MRERTALLVAGCIAIESAVAGKKSRGSGFPHRVSQLSLHAVNLVSQLERTQAWGSYLLDWLVRWDSLTLRHCCTSPQGRTVEVLQTRNATGA